MKKLIDLHTHLLPKTDDGARTTKESLQCFEQAIKLGFETIVLTPHFLNGSSFSYERNWEEFRKLKKRVSKKRLKINLILANEIMLDEKVIDNLVAKKSVSINKSKYLLVELPIYYENNIENMLDKIKEQGYIPIIAHPERNSFFQTDMTKIEALFQQNVLFQVNGVSLLGYYGRKAKEVAEYILENNFAHFIASDSHGEYDYMEKVLKHLQKNYGDFLIEKLLITNPKRVIENKKL